MPKPSGGYRKKYRKYTVQDFKRYYTLNQWGYYYPEILAGLKKCWRGFFRASRVGDDKNIVYYVAGVHKFEKMLGKPLTNFHEANMMGWYDRADYAKYVQSEKWGGPEQLEEEEE